LNVGVSSTNHHQVYYNVNTSDSSQLSGAIGGSPKKARRLQKLSIDNRRDISIGSDKINSDKQIGNG
jgi:hypothetical protein